MTAWVWQTESLPLEVGREFERQRQWQCVTLGDSREEARARRDQPRSTRRVPWPVHARNGRTALWMYLKHVDSEAPGEQRSASAFARGYAGVPASARGVPEPGSAAAPTPASDGSDGLRMLERLRRDLRTRTIYESVLVPDCAGRRGAKVVALTVALNINIRAIFVTLGLYAACYSPYIAGAASSIACRIET